MSTARLNNRLCTVKTLIKVALNNLILMWTILHLAPYQYYVIYKLKVTFCSLFCFTYQLVCSSQFMDTS